jgi:hypothetical protein
MAYTQTDLTTVRNAMLNGAKAKSVTLSTGEQIDRPSMSYLERLEQKIVRDLKRAHKRPKQIRVFTGRGY